MLNNVHWLFEMNTMNRFTDPVLISILTKMRHRGGSQLTTREWQALCDTAVTPEAIQEDPEKFIKDTEGSARWAPVFDVIGNR